MYSVNQNPFSIHTKLHRSKTLFQLCTLQVVFSIHTKLHRSKTAVVFECLIFLFSIHTKLHRSKTYAPRELRLRGLVSIRNYIALKRHRRGRAADHSLVSIRNYIALKLIE